MKEPALQVGDRVEYNGGFQTVSHVEWKSDWRTYFYKFKGYINWIPEFDIIKPIRKVVDGVGPDAPTIITEQGGKHSASPYRFDLVDAPAMFEMTKVLAEGAAKYGDDNWRLIPVRDHLNHLLVHAYAYLAGDKSDNHLSHMLCRAMFAVACDMEVSQK